MDGNDCMKEDKYVQVLRAPCDTTSLLQTVCWVTVLGLAEHEVVYAARTNSVSTSQYLNLSAERGRGTTKTSGSNEPSKYTPL